MLQHWTPERILALAPNARAAQAGRQLATPHLWSSRGTTAEVAWGECQWRADTPYQIRIDLTRLVFQCTCLSRQSPCKHSLGLLLMLAEAPDAWPDTTPPAWVTAELPRRGRRGSARPPSAHRIAQRHATVRAGLVGLKRWLRDLVHQGLATVLDKPASFWQQPAARLVDAQAPGLARLVRACAQDVASGADDWQERVVQRLGSLYLAVTGYARFDTLAPGAQTDLCTFIGWPQRREDALATPGQRDCWLVIGQHRAQEDRLTTQRTWLWGQHSGQAALVLEFAHGRAPRDISLCPGTQVDAALVFYPSAFPLRALVKTCSAPARPLTTWGGTPHLQTALQTYATALARNPWLSQYPFVLQDVTVERQTATRWIVRDGTGHTLPLVAGFPYGWSLLALSRHQAFGLCGEWDGEALRPLGIWTGEHFIDCNTLIPVATPQEGGDVLTPPSPVWQELVSAACVGTSRHPASLALVTPAGRTPGLQRRAADPQSSLLKAVATLTLSQRAGRVLTCALPNDPWPDDHEVLPRCRAGAGKHLGLMLSGYCQEVLPEWLEALATTRQRVPEEHLPTLLELGSTHPDLRLSSRTKIFLYVKILSTFADP